MGSVAAVKVQLPTGWTERPRNDDIREFLPENDDTKGTLQVSKLPDNHFEFLVDQPDLGGVAAELGKGFSEDGLDWGRAAATKQGICRLGRYGVSGFVGGQFPSMLLWVIVSNDMALLWTWLGPDTNAPEVKHASQVVLDATQSD